jgi:hypothetical protein
MHGEHHVGSQALFTLLGCAVAVWVGVLFPFVGFEDIARWELGKEVGFVLVVLLARMVC